MRLFCSACQSTHYFRSSQVERLVYVLQENVPGKGRCLGDVLRASQQPRRAPFLFGLVESRMRRRRSARVTLP